MRIVIAVMVVVAGGSQTASAQVCTQSSPGVAHVQTVGGGITINVANGSVPKVNGVSCGFAASAIDIVGVAGKDTVVLNYVPPTIPVTMQLAGGADQVTVYLTNAADDALCVGNAVDRDDDGDIDLDFLSSTLARLTFYARNGNDRVDCSTTSYKLTIYGGAGNDVLYGGPLTDTLDGGPDNDTLDANAGNDRVDGGFGHDTVLGDDGNDTLVARNTYDGFDAYDGGAGTDTLSYASRTEPVLASMTWGFSEDIINDTIETIVGGKGDDRMDFTLANLSHTVRGGPGNDQIYGGHGADKLYGEAGNDFVAGGGAKDLVIDGGDGDDSMGPSDDGFAETVRCGAGTDSYFGNTEDTFSGCESPRGLDTGTTIAAGSAHTCAILVTGAVKCWGFNNQGQLGHGTTVAHGDAPGTMGAALPTTDLGTDRTAVALAAGYAHTCALLDDGSVKCWGANELGQLGLGDTQQRGDDPGEMGDALPAVDLGTGRTAVAIAAGKLHSCAILDDGAVKCWGLNDNGQLGLGDVLARGDGPGEMGDALPAVNLGTGHGATAIAASSYHTCAILDDETVKCWGRGALGTLGQGDTTTRGDGPGEMGDALPPVALGTGRTALQVSATEVSTCALLDDRTVKCWGSNQIGQLGSGELSYRGDGPGEMGDAMPILLFGHAATAVTAGLWRHCALLDNGTAECWGVNLAGALGQGDTDARGDEIGELTAMPPIDVGTGRSIVAFATSLDYHACAKLDDATVKCWGFNGLGSLGLEDTLDRGDEPGEMGDALPAVDLGGLLLRATPTIGAVAISDAIDEPASEAEAIDGGEPDLGDEGVDPEDDVEHAAGGCSAGRGSGSGGLVVALAAVAVAVRRTRRRQRRNAMTTPTTYVIDAPTKVVANPIVNSLIPLNPARGSTKP